MATVIFIMAHMIKTIVMFLDHFCRIFSQFYLTNTKVFLNNTIFAYHEYVEKLQRSVKLWFIVVLCLA